MFRRAYSNISSPLLFFVILALLTVWLDYLSRPSAQGKDDGLYYNPDYIAENLTGVRVDHQQEIQRQFSAQKLSHYLHEKTTHLEHINFLNQDSQKPMLSIKAGRAIVQNKGKEIDLMDNIVAVRGADDEKIKITLTTDFLRLNPNENLITTDHAVTIIRHKSRIEAKGLEFNNRIGQIQLLSAVKVFNNK